jgi:DNA adenine methylase
MSIAACDDTTRPTSAVGRVAVLQSTLSSTLCIRKPGVTTNKQPDDIPMPTPKLAPRKLTKPVKWHGGKDYIAPRIIEEMAPHTHFVEAFAGGLSVLIRKDGEGISEVVNDLNGELTNFWKTLQSEELYTKIQRRIEAIPFSQVEFLAAIDNTSQDPLDRTVAFFVRMRQSRQGLGRDFATLSRNRTRRGMNEQASSWLGAIEGLPEIHARLKRVVVMNVDAIKLIKQQDGPQTLFYCDPPYVHETRSSTGEYGDFEMTLEQHRELLAVLAAIKGKFILSGYHNRLYDQWADKHGFRCVEIEIDNKASSKKTKDKKVECLWKNC